MRSRARSLQPGTASDTNQQKDVFKTTAVLTYEEILPNQERSGKTVWAASTYSRTRVRIMASKEM